MIRGDGPASACQTQGMAPTELMSDKGPRADSCRYVFRVVWGKKQRRKSSPAPDDPGRSAMPPLPHRGRHLQGRPATRRNTPTTTKARTHAKETSPPNQATQEDFENLPTRQPNTSLLPYAKMNGRHLSVSLVPTLICVAGAPTQFP